MTAARHNLRGIVSVDCTSGPGERIETTLLTGAVSVERSCCPCFLIDWEPSAAPNRAWLICERPALCRQTNRTVATSGLTRKWSAELAGGACLPVWQEDLFRLCRCHVGI
jgi:hypothetical protein